MKVFRVQNDRGKGPYTTGRKLKNDDLDNMLDYHCCHLSRYPEPWDDGIEYVCNPFWKCGFISRDQLNNWFTSEELGILEDSGFKVCEVEAEKVVVGNKQVIFWESKDENFLE